MESMKRCPYCGEEILAVAVKCKNCGSAIGGIAGSVKKQFRIGPTFAVIGVILLLALGAGIAYNWTQTGTLSGHGFTDADVNKIKRDIGTEFANRRGVTVEQVEMLRESPTKLTGFVKIHVPLLGTINKSCSATMGDNGQSIWRCQ